MDRVSDPSPAPGSAPASRLERAIAQLGSEHEPPLGWQVRVFIEIDRRGYDARRRPWWRFAFPALALGVLVFPLVCPARYQTSPTPPTVAIRRVFERQVTRGGDGPDGAAGDRFRVSTRGPSTYRAIWLYREEGELVAACPGHPSCRDVGRNFFADGELSLELTLDQVGLYLAVAIAADHPLPTPRGVYDADLATAHESGAETRQEILHVQ